MEFKPLGQKVVWIERIDWVRREAESQLSWMEQIDAQSTPPGGRSILGHWFDLSRLHTRRYLPLLQSILKNNKRPQVPSGDECITTSRGEESPTDIHLPESVAKERQLVTSHLKSISDSQWEGLMEAGDSSSEPPLLSLLNEITDRDRLILREMSLQLLDRHREELSQREIRQRMPSREDT